MITLPLTLLPPPPLRPETLLSWGIDIFYPWEFIFSFGPYNVYPYTYPLGITVAGATVYVCMNDKSLFDSFRQHFSQYYQDATAPQLVLTQNNINWPEFTCAPFMGLRHSRLLHPVFTLSETTDQVVFYPSTFTVTAWWTSTRPKAVYPAHGSKVLTRWGLETYLWRDEFKTGDSAGLISPSDIYLCGFSLV